MRKQTRYFALKLPIAVDAKSTFLAYVDPGKDSDIELRSWGDAHEWLWRALRGKGIKVQVVAIGADHDATIRAETALKRWSNGASKQVEQIAEEPTQDDPAVKAEMIQIEDVMGRGDRAGLSKYGGFQGATLRLIELRNLPKSKGTTGVSIDSYETWVLRRLRMLETDLMRLRTGSSIFWFPGSSRGSRPGSSSGKLSQGGGISWKQSATWSMRDRCCSTWRNSRAPASEVMGPPSKAATTRRLSWPSNSRGLVVHGVGIGSPPRI